MVEPAVFAQRGNGAKQHSEDRANHPGADNEDGRVDQPRCHLAPHGLTVGEGVAEPAREQAGEPEPVLIEQSSVQMELNLKRLQALRRGRVTEHRVRGVAGQHLGREEHDDRDDEQRDHADRRPRTNEGGDRVVVTPGCLYRF